MRHLRFFEMVLRTTHNFFDMVLSTTQSFFGGICHSLQPVRLKLDEWLKMIEPHSQSTCIPHIYDHNDYDDYSQIESECCEFQGTSGTLICFGLG